MSWEVSNLIINDDSGVTIAKGSTTLANVKPSNMYAQYLSDAQEVSLLNVNANTIICGKGNNSKGYADVFGWTLPTDKTIYIQTDQNDGNVWFWWDGLSDSSSFGNNGYYYRGISFSQYYTYGFKFSDSAINCYGGMSSKTINSKIYYAQTWLGSSAQFLPLIWTTISLSNFVINGERYDSNKSGGAGSGYIGNSLLSNKKMVGYNVPTSSAESTKTESVNEASENPVSGKPKIGNGYARIKFLQKCSIMDISSSVVENYYMSTYSCGPDDGLNHISSRVPDIIPYLDTDKCICFGQANKKALASESNMFKYENTRDTSGSMELIPIGTKRVKHISFKYQKPYSNNPEWNHFILQLVNISNDGTLNEAITVVSDMDTAVSQEWHDISYTCDAVITHIATTGVQSTWYMKDLQIIYADN